MEYMEKLSIFKCACLFFRVNYLAIVNFYFDFYVLCFKTLLKFYYFKPLFLLFINLVNLNKLECT